MHLRTPDRMRMETMTFARQAGAAVFLVTVTLSMQCAGIAVLISWARASVERGIARLSSLHAAVLMIRFSTLSFRAYGPAKHHENHSGKIAAARRGEVEQSVAKLKL